MDPQTLPDALASLLRAHLATSRDDPVEAAVAVLDAAGPGQRAALLEALSRAGGHWGIHRADPTARALSRAFLDRLLGPAPEVDLSPLPARGPALLVGNHLSYVDTQVTDLLLARHLGAPTADRLLVLAGPKVYTDPFRRLAAVGLNTLKVPQSASVAHGVEVPPPREMARLVRAGLETCRRWWEAGGLVLVYPEGSRSPDGRLQPFLRAVGRYLEVPPEVPVLPLALAGTDRLFGRDERFREAEVGMRTGPPLPPAHDRLATLEAAWRSLADLLPPHHAPDPATPPIRPSRG